MARHHEKLIRDVQAATAEVGQRPERTDRMTRAEVESFVKGFGLSARATRQLVAAWNADADRAHREGYDSGQEDASYY